MQRLQRHHDMGGRDAGPIERAEHDYAPWEKKVDAILRLASANGVFNIDEHRRGVEELGPGIYDELTYYERWISAITHILLEKGVLHVDELGREMAAIEARWGQP
ncbi:MAG: nitrile hydratase subunit beta [Geminicoccaceae bacterium]|nr:MAG: nitrile hydratase subunit beta [Geminicoccaceae bacterium]